MLPILSPAIQPKRRLSSSSSDDDQLDVIDSSWRRRRKCSKPSPVHDYESKEKFVAKCLILLSLSGGRVCLSSSSRSTASGTEEESNSNARKHQEYYSPTTPAAFLNDEKHQETSFSTMNAKKQQESSPTTIAGAMINAKNRQEFDPAKRPQLAEVNSYKCNICGKAFQSFQALGGHKTNHRAKPTAAAAEDLNTTGSKRHECRKVFQSGVALGGHKQKQFEGKISRSTARKDKTGVPTAAAATHITGQLPDINTNSDQVVEGSFELTLLGKRIYTGVPTDCAAATTHVTESVPGSVVFILFGKRIYTDRN